MRWFVDECVSPEIVRALRQSGHDVVSALEQFQAAGDALILDLAGRDGRILLTEDNGFGEMISRRSVRSGVAGVVLIRMSTEKQIHKLARLAETIAQFDDQLVGNFVVIGETRSRSRPLPG